MGSRTWKRHTRTRKEEIKQREFAKKHFKMYSDNVNSKNPKR